MQRMPAAHPLQLSITHRAIPLVAVCRVLSSAVAAAGLLHGSGYVANATHLLVLDSQEYIGIPN